MDESGQALGNLPLKRKSYVSRYKACNLVFNAESQERQHYTEKTHAKRMRMVAIEEKAGETIQSVLQSNGFSCQFCDMVLNSLEQLEHHRIGKIIKVVLLHMYVNKLV